MALSPGVERHGAGRRRCLDWNWNWRSMTTKTRISLNYLGCGVVCLNQKLEVIQDTTEYQAQRRNRGPRHARCWRAGVEEAR